MKRKKVKYCIDCKKILKDRRSIRCFKCQCIFKTKHPRKNCIVCNKKLSRNAQFRCMSCWTKYNKGINHINYQNKGFCSNNNYYCKDCMKLITSDTAIYGSYRCRSCATKYQFLTVGLPAGKQIKYKSIWMRSSWEVAYAKYLDNLRIKWSYEPKTFDLGNTTYTPDFYLPETDTYIEIKGYWRPDALNKFLAFKLLYPEIKIIIYNQEKLKKSKIL